ncbi:MAG: MBL fold metallo-hydrolase, partial [Patescibacteria group bacterium]|nr:MBL fold metallo-hydrolase [Patescibacteria group bacterium]
MKMSAKILGVVVPALLVVSVLVWSAVFSSDHRGQLTVSFLDVGQGSAVYIAAPSGRKVLVDGGPDSSVLRKLSALSPWWSRSLDVVVSTSPDKDSSTGLVDILRRYRVALILRSNVRGTDSASRALLDAIDTAANRGAMVVSAKRGQILDLGGGAYLEILSPDRDTSGVSAGDGCVVMRLTYGATSFMLPCDAPRALENYLAYLDADSLHADVLEAGSGGAKTSSSPLFIGYVSPDHVVYSRDCKYNIPEETSDTFTRFGSEALDTCANGTITFTS